MNVSYIYINIAAFLCFALMFVAFCAAERSREMRAWLVLLGDLVLWTGGTVFMRLHVFPSYEFWYYVSLLSRCFRSPFWCITTFISSQM